MEFGRSDLDIPDRDTVWKTVKETKPDVIVHCAAWTGVNAAEEQAEACRRVNADGTANIAAAAAEVASKLIYLSTDYVFDGHGTTPWKETDECRPLNVYGRSKLDGENAVRQALDRHFIVRSSWLYGRMERTS